MITACAKRAVVRIITVVTVMILISSACVAMAESTDLTQLTDDEVLILHEQVQKEIANRGLEKTATIATGQYVGGKDIPVGSYVLICKTDSDHYGIVWVSAANDNLDKDYPSKLYEFIDTDADETFYIDVEEGDILCVPFAAELRISGGVTFQ